ncbi:MULTISPECIES: alpha/beta hydrolase [Actinomadura]|uniref:Alpha/beta hydrolase n=1 Tax=Actinomadura yumaensis TaxID=111807 RepID=A0ABW2D1K6_9ACTN|nr:alpha/beta hydrolase [Actinomadura sp. J1-007]
MRGAGRGAGKAVAAGAAAVTVAFGTLTAAAAERPPGPNPAPNPAPRPAGLAWSPCPKKDRIEGDALKNLECANVRVPLDHARPGGEQITLALTRARHTARTFQGVVLLNRGGPGAHGRDLPASFTAALPKETAAQYDWIGFDARGVGASEPALLCDRSYLNPGRPRADTVPSSAAEARAWQRRATAYADDCARRYPRFLPHLGTADWARDLDAIRAALRQDRINYFGYSYGTYLGAVYATMFPGRVRRMVLDSVVRPSGVWYDANLDQNVAFEKRIRMFFGWVARHHDVYRLGRTANAVAASYAKARARVKAEPIDGLVGASELDDTFLTDGYADSVWPRHAAALSAYLVRADPKPLRKAWKPPVWLDQNNYAVYSAVQCRDAAWPRDWSRWTADSARLYRAGYRFETWSNTWYNAPCAAWRVPGGPPPAVRERRGMPPILLVQATEDAATPYSGAVETHRLFPSSRLVVQVGGGNHGVALSGDKCVDGAVARYFASGALPPGRRGPDTACPAPAGPKPARASGRREAVRSPAADAGAPVREPVAVMGARTS